jgi:hypothetical protein
VGILAAPVFGADGRPVLSLVLEGFRLQIVGADLRRLGERLLVAAATVTHAVGGRQPEFRPLGPLAADEPRRRATGRAGAWG